VFFALLFFSCQDDTLENPIITEYSLLDSCGTPEADYYVFGKWSFGCLTENFETPTDAEAHIHTESDCWGMMMTRFYLSSGAELSIVFWNLDNHFTQCSRLNFANSIQTGDYPFGIEEDVDNYNTPPFIIINYTKGPDQYRSALYVEKESLSLERMI
jgi:hypothetical protein